MGQDGTGQGSKTSLYKEDKTRLRRTNCDLWLAERKLANLKLRPFNHYDEKNLSKQYEMTEKG